MFAVLMIRFYDLRLTARNALEMRKYRTQPRSTGLQLLQTKRSSVKVHPNTIPLEFAAFGADQLLFIGSL